MANPLREADPTVVGPYRLSGRLGGGGMGQVFLGRSPGGRPVAVKIVRPDLADDAEFRRRFTAEVTAARTVSGFYTAQVVDADPDADPPWLATAYVPGPSLYQAVVDRGPLPLESVARMGAGLAEGLASVHASGVIHRDLKPANVILAEDGPRLIDFGIARALDGTAITRSRTVLGTAAFMSPEQASADRVSPAGDVFSLGCVLAYAATGRGPFGQGPPLAVLYRIVQEEPDLTDLPGELEGIVRACLAKDPAERPSPAQVLKACAAWTGTAPRPRPGPWPPGPATGADSERTERLTDPDTEPTVEGVPVAPPGAGHSEPSPGGTRVDRPRDRALPGPSPRSLLVLFGVLAVVVGGGYYLTRQYVENQYFIGPSPDGETVSIYQGVDGDLFGLPLSEQVESTAIRPEDLTEGDHTAVENTVPVEDMDAARERIDDLVEFSAPAE